MSVKKYKFVSPGIFIKEVDQSFITPAAPAVGPVIIGRTPYGPAMRPIRVESFGEYVRTFGNPVSGFKGGDIWRLGNVAGPTYAAYAAQAYLAAGVGPVNVMRLLGVEHSNRTSAGKAGWTLGAQAASFGSNAGSYGLWLFNSASMETGGTGNEVDGTLAAVFYLKEGMIVLDGTVRNGLGVNVTGSSCLFRTATSNPADHELRAEIYNAAGTKVHETSFNFNRDSDLYIRKVFNTNPQKTNNRFTQTADLETYWLGQSFDQSVTQVITGSTNNHNLGMIAGLKKGTAGFHNQNMPYQNGYTGWFIAQDQGPAGSFSVKAQQKLFRLAGLEGGASTQRQFKVSIEEIKPSPNSNITLFGSFSVVLRSLRDSDNKVLVIERFDNCDLDPNSPNYVAKKIGDMYMKWDDSEGRFREYGDNPNRSTHVRVVMNEAVDNGAVEPTLLPYGVLGPQRPDSWRMIGNDGQDYNNPTATNIRSESPRVKDATTHAGTAASNAYFLGGNSIPHNLGHASTNTVNIGGHLTASVHYPALLLRSSSLDGGLSDDTNAYFGVNTNRSRTSTTFDESVVDHLLPWDENQKDQYDPSVTGYDYSYLFSLDDLAYDTSLKCMNYVSGSRAAGTSLSAISSSYSASLNLGYDRFTTVFHGGFDGVDVTEMEPFNNAIHGASGANQFNNYAFASVRRAITAVSDPEFIEMNLLAAPGVKTNGLTNYMTEICEERGDALAIIDIDGDYTPRTESTAGATSRRGSVSSAVNSMKSRLMDTSYGACYYPWVQIRDTISSANVWVPPSVAALGTLASSEAASAVWFAPAGFNRGGLTEGAAGIPVISARQRLSRKDRDNLYERNVNPIAKFPNEGLVIFGQKTLQAKPSALDRVNVRRLMIYLKKEISRVATQVLFDNNVEATWLRFKSLVNPILSATKAQFGLTEYKLILDETTTTPDLIDQNILYAKIMLKPARAIEYIAIDFNIMPTGASFDD